MISKYRRPDDLYFSAQPILKFDWSKVHSECRSGCPMILVIMKSVWSEIWKCIICTTTSQERTLVCLDRGVHIRTYASGKLIKSVNHLFALTPSYCYTDCANWKFDVCGFVDWIWLQHEDNSAQHSLSGEACTNGHRQNKMLSVSLCGIITILVEKISITEPQILISVRFMRELITVLYTQ